MDYEELLFNVSDIGFASTLAGDLAVAGLFNSELGYSDSTGVVRFASDGMVAETLPILEGFLNNPLFIGQSESLVCTAFDEQSSEILIRLERATVPAGDVYAETERHTFSTDARLMNLGSNRNGEAVGFYEVRGASTNFDVAEAGFYRVSETPGSFERFSIDFSTVLENGQIMESLFVQIESMSPGGSFVIMESHDSGNERRSLLYNFQTDTVSDVGAQLPADFANDLRALFPADSLRIPTFNPGQLVERIDAEGNLIGRVTNEEFETVGSFVVMNTNPPQVIGLETYLAAILAEPADMSLAAFLGAVEIVEIAAFAENGSSVLLAGLASDGLSDAFLMPIADAGAQLADDDNDGLPNFWEAEQGADSVIEVDPTSDLAGDGLTALEEFFFGLPFDGGNASPPLSPLALDGDNLVFEFTRRTRIDLLEFDIEASATLMPDSWAPVSPVLQVIGESGETTRFRATLPQAPNTEKLFLRFVIQPIQ